MTNLEIEKFIDEINDEIQQIPEFGDPTLVFRTIVIKLVGAQLRVLAEICKRLPSGD